MNAFGLARDPGHRCDQRGCTLRQRLLILAHVDFTPTDRERSTGRSRMPPILDMDVVRPWRKAGDKLRTAFVWLTRTEASIADCDVVTPIAERILGQDTGDAMAFGPRESLLTRGKNAGGKPRSHAVEDPHRFQRSDALLVWYGLNAHGRSLPHAVDPSRRPVRFWASRVYREAS